MRKKAIPPTVRQLKYVLSHMKPVQCSQNNVCKALCQSKSKTQTTDVSRQKETKKQKARTRMQEGNQVVGL